MAVIKAAEFAWPRMEAPDLDQMEEFLTHFGLSRAERTPTALYMRGTDDHPHLHVTHKGGTKFIGFAYTPPTRMTWSASPGCPAPRESRRWTSRAAASASA